MSLFTATTQQSPRNLPISHSVPKLGPFPSHYPKHPPFGLLPTGARLPAQSLVGTLETALLSPSSTGKELFYEPAVG